jgi:hypothetical protein
MQNALHQNPGYETCCDKDKGAGAYDSLMKICSDQLPVYLR